MTSSESHVDSHPAAYRFGLVPPPDRRGHWRCWWRTGVAFALAVVLAIAMGSWVSGTTPPWGCVRGWLPFDDVWSADGECVGISDGSYAFGRADLQPAF